jgi:hypothetical protein
MVGRQRHCRLTVGVDRCLDAQDLRLFTLGTAPITKRGPPERPSIAVLSADVPGCWHAIISSSAKDTRVNELPPTPVVEAGSVKP